MQPVRDGPGNGTIAQIQTLHPGLHCAHGTAQTAMIHLQRSSRSPKIEVQIARDIRARQDHALIGGGAGVAPAEDKIAQDVCPDACLGVRCATFGQIGSQIAALSAFRGRNQGGFCRGEPVCAAQGLNV